jgi:hypothetical protein
MAKDSTSNKKKPAARQGAAKKTSEPDPERLAEMIEEATVDAHDEEEQLAGFFSMLEENLDLPFSTRVLGIEVEVTDLDYNEGGEFVARCVAGKHRQAISLLDLPLPSPLPPGAEWIAAYRAWKHTSHG